jgi:lipopolysaccharide transport system ATP-binding protein
MSEAIITVENLGKKYHISHQAQRQSYVALRDVIAQKFAAPFNFFRKVGKSKRSDVKAPASDPPLQEDFWALKGVSFEVKQGEVVGVIGRNGAGKSTLLKILSRITEPTEGCVRLLGRVASLLEVGTGFHGELTGRENIFLNGAILGMSRAEIKRKFDEIVAFSEVEKFLDTPVKRYSSGMYVRLAFAVAAHLEPEILIVDEVLAVGDVEFQKKCLGKMQDVAAKEGRTVLFVSHNMAAVSRLCQTGLLLDKGAIAARGNIASLVVQYLESNAGDKAQFIPDPAKAPVGNDTVILLGLTVKGMDGGTGPSFASNAALKVEITCRVLKPARGLRVGFHLHGADGAIVFNTTDLDEDDGAGDERSHRAGVYISACEIPAGFLNRGQYSITVGSDAPAGVNFYRENAVSFHIVPVGAHDTRGDNRPGLVCPNLKWDIINKS